MADQKTQNDVNYAPLPYGMDFKGCRTLHLVLWAIIRDKQKLGGGVYKGAIKGLATLARVKSRSTAINALNDLKREGWLLSGVPYKGARSWFRAIDKRQGEIASLDVAPLAALLRCAETEHLSKKQRDKRAGDARGLYNTDAR